MNDPLVRPSPCPNTSPSTNTTHEHADAPLWLLALSYTYDGGVLTLSNQDGLGVEVMNVVIPFRTFRMAAHLGTDGGATDTGVRIGGSTVCKGIPTYGALLQQLGLCNPQTDVLSVFGGANLPLILGGRRARRPGSAKSRSRRPRTW